MRFKNVDFLKTSFSRKKDMKLIISKTNLYIGFNKNARNSILRLPRGI